jgi:hypothetical protein
MAACWMAKPLDLYLNGGPLSFEQVQLASPCRILAKAAGLSFFKRLCFSSGDKLN